MDSPSNALILASIPIKDGTTRKITHLALLGLLCPRGGIALISCSDVSTQNVLTSASCVLTHLFLARTIPRTLREHQASTLEKDFSYLTNMADETLKE